MPGKKKKNVKQGKNLCTFKLSSDGSVYFKDEESLRIAQKLNIIPGEDEEITNSHLLDSESRRTLQEKYNIFAADGDDYNYLQHLKKRRKEEEQATEKIDSHIQPNSDAVLNVIKGKKVSTVVSSSEAQNEAEIDDDLKDVLAALDSDKEANEEEEDDKFFDSLLKSSAAENKPSAKRVGFFDDFDGDSFDDENFDIVEEEEEYDEDVGSDASDLENGSDNGNSPPGSNKMTCHGKQKQMATSEAAVLSVAHQYRNMRLEDKDAKDVEKIWSKAFDDLDDDDALSEDAEEDLTKDVETVRRVLEEDEENDRTVLMRDFIEKPADKDRIMDRFEYESNSSDEEMIEIVKTVDPLEGFDCESIISSRATNRTFTPKIVEILPLKPKRKKSSAKDQLEEDAASENSGFDLGHRKKIKDISVKDQDLETEKSAAILRCKDETAEQKKSRKMLVKEQQRERREEKSERKKMFSQEVQRRKQETMKTVQKNTSARIE